MSNQSLSQSSLAQRQVTLVVIDPAAENFQQLVAGVEPSAEVVILDSNQDGVAQVAAAIAQYHPQSLHLIAHGSPGCLYLGNGELSLKTLSTEAGAIATWFTGIEAPSLLLYGCCVAAGDAGEEFIQKLHHLTGAQVFASSNPVGASSQGGDWNLDSAVGNFDAQPAPALAITLNAQVSYAGVLGWVVSQKVVSDYAIPGQDVDNSGTIEADEQNLPNPENDLVSFEEFGSSVDIFGDFAVVGIPGDDPVEALADIGLDQGSLGAAYIYQRQSDGTWRKIQEIRPNDEQNTLGPELQESLIVNSSLAFGSSVAISGEGNTVRIVVGDPLAGRPTFNSEGPEPILQEFGAAYVYEADVSDPDNITWTQTRILDNVPPNAANTPLEGVFLDNGTVSALGLLNGNFGASVDISPDGTVAVGAPQVSTLPAAGTGGFVNAGRVYIFDAQGNVVSDLVEADLNVADSDNPPSENRFGTSVALNSNNSQLIVGVPGGARSDIRRVTDDLINGQIATQPGTAYIYTLDNGTWGNRQQLESPFTVNQLSEASTNDAEFGAAVSISTFRDPDTGVETDYAIVGAPQENLYTQQGNDFVVNQNGVGAAYIFKRNNDGTWTQVQRLEASDNGDPNFETTPDGQALDTDFDQFGSSVSLSGEYALVGASSAGEYINSLDEQLVPGAAYVFQFTEDENNPGQRTWTEIEAIRSIGVGTRFDQVTDTNDFDNVNADSFGRDADRTFGGSVAIYQDPVTGSVSGLVGAPSDQVVIGQDDTTTGQNGEAQRSPNDRDDIDSAGSAYFIVQRPEVIDVIFNDRGVVDPQPATTEERGIEDNIVSDADTGASGFFEITIVYNQSMNPNVVPDVQFFLDSTNDTPPAGEPNTTLDNLNIDESRWIEIDGVPNKAYVAVFNATDENVQFDINNPEFDLEVTGAQSAAGVEQEPARSPELDFLTDVFTIDTKNPTADNLATVNGAGAVENFFNNETLSITGAFSEAVDVFNLDQVVGTNFSFVPDSFTPTTLPVPALGTFSLEIDPTDEGAFDVVIPAGTFFDVAGNPNAEISLGTRTYDITSPEVQQLTASTDAGPVVQAVGVNGVFAVTATFTDNLSPTLATLGDAAEDFDVTNGTVDLTSVQLVTSEQQDDGTFLNTFTFTVTPTLPAGTQDGEISIGIEAGAVRDLAGNDSAASTEALTVRFDNAAPTPDLAPVEEDSNPDKEGFQTRFPTFDITVTFNEALDPNDPLIASEISVDNGTVVGEPVVDPNDSQKYTVKIEAGGPGDVTINTLPGAVIDLVGNGSTAAPQDLIVEFEPLANEPPVITVSDALGDATLDVRGDQTLTFGTALPHSISIDDENNSEVMTVTLEVTDPTLGTLTLDLDDLNVPGQPPLITFPNAEEDGINDSRVTFQGTEAAVNEALDGLIFDPANVNGQAVINITVEDAGLAQPDPNPLLAPLTATATATVVIERVLTPARHDFDGNGTSDLIFENPDDSVSIVLLDSNGTDVTVTQQTILFTPVGDFTQVVGSGEFNSDELPDLVLQDPDGAGVAIATTTEANGTVTLGPPTPISAPGARAGSDAAWRVNGVGDFNENGADDLIFRNQTTGETVLWLLDENGDFVQEVSLSPTIRDLRWQIEAVGDFDSDLAADIVWRNTATGQNLIWFTDFDGTSIRVRNAGTVESLSTNFKLLGSGDYNGDQISDLVYQDSTTGNVQLRLMNGTSILNTITLTSPPLPNASSPIVQN